MTVRMMTAENLCDSQVAEDQHSLQGSVDSSRGNRTKTHEFPCRLHCHLGYDQWWVKDRPRSWDGERLRKKIPRTSRAESLKQSNLEKQEVYNGPEIKDEQTGRQCYPREDVFLN